MAAPHRSPNLVVKVHMTRCIYEVDEVFSVVVVIVHGDCLCLNGDASLFLDFQLVEVLCFDASRYGVCNFEEPVSKCRFAVVDVCNDAEVTYETDGKSLGTEPEP